MGGGFRKGLRSVVAGLLLFGGAATATVIGGATPAWAQPSVSLYVASGGSGDCTSQANACGSVQTALTAATAGPYAGDDVTINVATGTYDENDTIDASSLNSLTIAGAGAASTTVNGSGSNSVFTVNGGTVNISGLTITDGEAAGGFGGGISNLAANLTVTDSALTNNDSFDGGAIANGSNTYYGSDTVLRLIDSTVSDNTSGYGGGISNSSWGTAYITDSTLTGNQANRESNGTGGGISNGGTLFVTGSTLTGNSANATGGGVSGGTATTITSSTVSGNSAPSGGGIYNDAGPLTVSGSTFSGNSAGTNGGAIDNADGGTGTATVSDSTFSGNSRRSTAGRSTMPTTRAAGRRRSPARPSGATGRGATAAPSTTPDPGRWTWPPPSWPLPLPVASARAQSPTRGTTSTTTAPAG